MATAGTPRAASVGLLLLGLGAGSWASSTNPSVSPTTTTVKPAGRVSGTVTVGPVCPAETPSPTCAPRVLPGAQVRLIDATGAVVAETATSGSGAFSLQAPLGAYQLDVAPRLALRCPSTKTTLEADTTTTLTVRCDSGIR